MLEKVGIPSAANRFYQYPHEISGGMRQRAVIAMAMVCRPQLLIADEPTTALDVTIQAQIIGLINKLQKENNTSCLLITHDIGVVAQSAHSVAVMYCGRIVEAAEVRELIYNPLHPYTKALLRSLPVLCGKNERLKCIEGNVPSPLHRPCGCPFHPRCEFAQPGRCDTEKVPDAEEIKPRHTVACFRAAQINQ